MRLGNGDERGKALERRDVYNLMPANEVKAAWG